MKLQARCFVFIFILIVAPLCSGAGMQPERADHGMVASVHELASQAGVDMMKAGGNAIDAAVATGFALAVVHPAAGNLGGGGFMLVRMSSGETHFLDFREKAPGKATSTMYQDEQGNVVPMLSRVGYKAVGVPGSVKGMVHAQKKYGKLTLQQVVAPAIKLAREGFELDWAEARALTNDKHMPNFPDSKRIFQNDGKGWRQGDVLKQPELARTLERIVANPDEFYTGKMAREIAEFMQQGGGLITVQDLKNYEVVDREPVRGTYRGLEVISAPPPSSGGIALVETLNILEGFDLTKAGFGSAEAIHLIAESYRRAFYDRAQYLGDPEFSTLPVIELADKKYAVDWRASIDPQRASASTRLERPQVSKALAEYAKKKPVKTAPESTQTTHYSVVDKDGNAVAVTTTLNGSYGSKVTIGSLGFLLNNEMDDFSAKAGVPNMFGLIQSDANLVGPNKRPLSAMTPTIVLKDGKLWLVLGSPGGPTIITTVANILIGVADFGLDIQQAVNAPRFHHQWLPDRIIMERNRFSPDTVKLLEARGHTVSFGLGGDGECIQIDLATGQRLGASDGRNERGRAVGY
ncbi:gamma-glutamyltransferase [Steroidobacter agaridevorans]|uniref:Glutathione hydrolase proenzyme n=1 Tax=Steroidobacter agaridevorans TaxID=2695856 RepID=A0A829YIA5_9GAMM|nr:gamma-glutamyltransferase [Steroidobacter agaridevorans]GFE82970.1 gamma-glutamyltransferase [Steroidobacter agaridevorans]